jgi:hypothetical protein
MQRSISLALLLLLNVLAHAQEAKLWTEADRSYLQDNLSRSRDELIQETRGLTKEQWNFKESPDRWSINEIVEHITLWELLMTHDVSRMLSNGPQPEMVAKASPDSTFRNFIMEEKQHNSTAYTKPFTYTVPMGLNSLENNVAWLLKMRNESISYITRTTDDLRLYFMRGGGSSIHQKYISLYGHTDRHLRQLRKVKKHPNYPTKK